MATVSFRFDADDRLGVMRELFSPSQFRKAMQAGLRYGARAGKTAAAKGVTAQYSLKSADIKNDIGDPRFVNNGETIEFRISNRPRTLRAYGARDTRKGLSVAEIRGRRNLYPRAWMGRGGRVAGLPVMRVGDQPYPLVVLHGPSVGRIICGRSAFGEQIRQDINERTNEQYLKGVERYFQSVARRGG